MDSSIDSKVYATNKSHSIEEATFDVFERNIPDEFLDITRTCLFKYTENFITKK